MPGCSKVTVVSSLILQTNFFAPSGSMPAMLSALCVLSVARNFTVSPGAILRSEGSNTMAPSAPLLSIFTSNSAAEAGKASASSAAATGIGTNFRMSCPFLRTCVRAFCSVRHRQLGLQRQQRRQRRFVAAVIFPAVAFGFAGEVAGTPCLAAAKGAATREVLRRSRLAPPQLFRVDPEKRKPAVQKDRRPAATGSNLHEGRPVE